MGAVAVRAGHPALEHRHRLGRVGALGRLAGRQVPQLPGGAVHQRLGEQRGHVEVVAELGVDRAHGVGVVVVPGSAVLGRRVLREARPQRADQRPLDRRAGAGQRAGAGDGAVSGGHGVDQLLPLEGLPVLVVVRADGVGEAPVRHRAVGVGRDRVLEAADGLLVVEAVGPDEAAVEPGLGVVRRGGDGAAEAAEVVVVVAEHGEGPIIRSLGRGCDLGEDAAAAGGGVADRVRCGVGDVRRQVVDPEPGDLADLAVAAGAGDAALDRPAEDEAQPVASAAQAVDGDQVVERDVEAGLLGDFAHGGLLRALARLEAAAGQAPATAAVGLVHEQHAAVGVEQHDRRSQRGGLGLVFVDQG